VKILDAIIFSLFLDESIYSECYNFSVAPHYLHLPGYVGVYADSLPIYVDDHEAKRAAIALLIPFIVFLREGRLQENSLEKGVERIVRTVMETKANELENQAQWWYREMESRCSAPFDLEEYQKGWESFRITEIQRGGFIPAFENRKGTDRTMMNGEWGK
jgi:hypothetical protein